jgi:hypothetical protein
MSNKSRRVLKLEQAKSIKKQIIVVEDIDKAPGIIRRNGELVTSEQFEKWESDPSIELVHIVIERKDMRKGKVLELDDL